MEIGQSQILINAQGEWSYEGNRIVHPEVLNLFKSSLTYDGEKGEFFIDYKGKRAPVKVAKTPYFIRDVGLEKSSAGELVKVVLEVDDGSREILDPENGKTYDCEIWLENDKLKVRGYIAFFYRTQTWEKVN